MGEEESVPLFVEFPDGVPVEFPEDDNATINLAVTCVAPGRYRLDNVPVFTEGAIFGDIVEADRLPDGTLRVRRVVKSSWTQHGFALARGSMETPRIQRVLQQVTEVGGYWENVFGGLLFICLPPGCDHDPYSALGMTRSD